MGKRWEWRLRLYQCAVFRIVVSAVHLETISTSTVAMLMVLGQCIYNKQYILKIDYLPILLINNFGCGKR